MALRNRVKLYKYKLAKHLRKHQTPSEKILWILLRRNKLGVRFHHQSILFGFIVDFWAPSIKLAIELDGPIHDKRKGYDNHRDAILREHGIVVVRFKNEEILDDVLLVLDKIKRISQLLTDKKDHHNAFQDVKSLENFKDNIKSLDDFI